MVTWRTLNPRRILQAPGIFGAHFGLQSATSLEPWPLVDQAITVFKAGVIFVKIGQYCAQDHFFRIQLLMLQNAVVFLLKTLVMYNRSNKKRNTPIYFNKNYRTEMKVVPIIIYYCLLQFDALKFFLGVRLHGEFQPNFNFFNVNPQIFQRNRKVHLINCLETNFHISIISLRVIRQLQLIRYFKRKVLSFKHQ